MVTVCIQLTECVYAWGQWVTGYGLRGWDVLCTCGCMNEGFVINLLVMRMFLWSLVEYAACKSVMCVVHNICRSCILPCFVCVSN